MLAARGLKQILAAVLVVTNLGFTPRAHAANSCVDVFANQNKWSVPDALELIRQADPVRFSEFEPTFDLITKHTLKPLATKFRPEVLRETRGFDQAAQLIESAIRKDQFLHAIFRGKFKIEKKDRAVDWLNRRILSDGLANVIDSKASGIHKVTRRDRLLVQIKRITSLPVIRQLLWIPGLYLHLPRFDDRTFPPDLLAKIIVDGVPAHRAELDARYKALQFPLDTYRKVDVGYQIAIWSVCLLMIPQYMEQAEDLAEKVQVAYSELQSERAVKAVTEETEAIDAALDGVESELNRRGIGLPPT